MIDRFLKIQQDARTARDRWLHPLRRRAAKRMLSEYEGTSILVICQGNVCRSPFAEAVLRASLPPGMEVRSAGFIAPGRCAPPDAVSVARRFGIDLTKHCSRRITVGLVQAAGLIVVMDAQQARELIDRFGAPLGRILVLGDLDPFPIEERGLQDPINQPRDAFVDCYDRIDRCARELGRVLHRAARSRAPMYGEADLTPAAIAPRSA
jgi:protein-tyrosine phosphatase